MVTKFENRNNGQDVKVKDIFCIVKNKEDDFYWVINLEDHPSLFLLDHSYHNFLPPQFKKDQESLVVIQPTM
jgi:hypothetical protein